MTTEGSGATDPVIGMAVGTYVVQRRLGEGGMGAVYELLHPGIQKRLAMKLLHAEYAAKPQIVQRFFDEARAVNLIGHPNIVDIIDFASLPDGRSYITMEFLEGDSLAEHIRRSGPMAPAEVREILLPICSALEAAHGAGIVHRDLKPENIHLVPRRDNPRYVKVLDFGIAKLGGDQAMPGAATRSGVVMGTPTYMSPEQAMGRTREIDHRTDIYALGIIAYQMLAGGVPFSAESFGDLMLLHLQEPPPPLAARRPDLPPGWGQMVDIALAKAREDRFQSMAEAAAAIEAAAAGRPVSRSAAGAATLAAPGATVARPPGAAVSSSPPAIPGGTMRYDSAPGVPGSYPGGAPGSYPGGAPGSWPPGTQPPAGQLGGAPGTSPDATGKARWAVPVAVAAILGVAAVVVVLILQGSGGDRTAAAVADAGAAAIAVPPAPPADAAVVAADPPPDAAPIAAAPIDAAPRTRPSSTTRPPAATQRGEGKVRVVVTPWAEILVDGKSLGYTPKTITLPAGRQRIRLRNTELGKDETRTVRVTPGETAPLTLSW